MAPHSLGPPLHPAGFHGPRTANNPASPQRPPAGPPPIRPWTPGGGQGCFSPLSTPCRQQCSLVGVGLPPNSFLLWRPQDRPACRPTSAGACVTPVLAVGSLCHLLLRLLLLHRAEPCRRISLGCHLLQEASPASSLPPGRGEVLFACVRPCPDSGLALGLGASLFPRLGSWHRARDSGSHERC